MYFIGRILPALVAFFGVTLYSRFSDPKTYGTFSVILSASLLIGIVGSAWLRVAALRTAGSVDEHERADYFATVSILYVLVAFAIGATVVLGVHLYNPALEPATLVLAGACAVSSAGFELTVSIAQSEMKVALYGLLQLARATLILAATLALLAAGHTVDALLGGFVAGNCVAIAALALWRPAFGGRFRPALFLRLFRFGWPSSAGSITWFSPTFQRYFLDVAIGSSAVGVFAVADTLATQTVGLLIGTAAIAGQPLAFRARDSGAAGALAAQLADNARLILAVALPASAGLALLAGPVSHVFLGRQFRDGAAPVIAITAFAVMLGSLRSGYFEQAFELTLQTHPVAILSACSVALRVALSVGFIPRYGVTGAAAASLVADAILLGVTAVWSRRLLHMPFPPAVVLKTALATGAMLGAIALVPERDSVVGLLCAIALGSAVYGAAMVALSYKEVRSKFGARVAWPAR